jgi:fumarylacetoacetate (FAA) hydrolase
VKVAHIREQRAPAGTPWRLAAALDLGEAPARWLDLEIARRRAITADPNLAHDAALFRQPVTTLDDQLGRGLRIEVLGELLDSFAGARDEEDEAVLDVEEIDFGPPVLRPPSLRDFYAFEGHVATMWRRRGQDVPEAWYRLPIFYFSNTSEIRGPGEPVWAPRGCEELDFELEVCAVVDTPALDLPADRADEAIGGYTILNDWSARDLQRDETTVRLGPAKGKDFASTIGPWIVTPDELTDARAGKGYDLEMTAVVGEIGVSRGRLSDARFSFAEMLERASADVQVRPGDLVGSGTVGTGCLLEVKDETLGRWLEPGDEVTLRVDRLGELSSPVIQRPSMRR